MANPHTTPNILNPHGPLIGPKQIGVYEAAINKKYLTDEQRKALEDKPSVLEPWDPFGTLVD